MAPSPSHVRSRSFRSIASHGTIEESSEEVEAGDNNLDGLMFTVPGQ